MQYTEKKRVTRSVPLSDTLIAQARQEARRDQAQAVSARLEALATVIQQGLSTGEIAELLRTEAQRYVHESQEVQ